MSILEVEQSMFFKIETKMGKNDVQCKIAFKNRISSLYRKYIVP